MKESDVQISKNKKLWVLLRRTKEGEKESGKSRKSRRSDWAPN
jgi:hypothetical protein